MENTVKGGLAVDREDQVTLAMQGDRDAFTRLVMENEGFLYRAAMAVLGNEQDAQDAAQEAVLVAWKKIGRLRQPEAFRAWLLKILRRECMAVLRQRKKHGHAELEDALDTAGPEPSLDRQLEVSTTLERLAPPDKLVLSLYYGDGTTTRELAALFGISETAVRQRLHRARGKFREIYGEE